MKRRVCNGHNKQYGITWEQYAAVDIQANLLTV